MKISLVDDWHKAWKWSSVRLMGLSGAAEVALHYFHNMPSEVTQYINQSLLSTIATGAFILAFLGRITQMEKKSSDDPPKSS